MQSRSCTRSCIPHHNVETLQATAPMGGKVVFDTEESQKTCHNSLRSMLRVKSRDRIRTSQSLVCFVVSSTLLSFILLIKSQQCVCGKTYSLK